MVKTIDVLIVAALPMEFDAVRGALSSVGTVGDRSYSTSASTYIVGALPTSSAGLSVALARPTRMGGINTAPIAASLCEALAPQCIAMCGVCAGNPVDVTLGDVVVAECAYAYDEGKRTDAGFVADQRQIPLTDKWMQIAQDFKPKGLSSYGSIDAEAVRIWLLEQMDTGINPALHPALPRYLGEHLWTEVIRTLVSDGCVIRDGEKFAISKLGQGVLAEYRAFHLEPPLKLPYAVHVGPMASGNVVVKDGVTWDMLIAHGVRTVLALEMEAASIAQVAHRLAVPHWIVVKGVMDYADTRKNNRFKSFAARASAEVLLALLQIMPFATKFQLEHSQPKTGMTANTIGNIDGTNISITQSVRQIIT